MSKEINLKILDVIKKEVEENPDKNFNQILYDLNIINGHRDEKGGLHINNELKRESEDLFKEIKFKNNDYIN